MSVTPSEEGSASSATDCRSKGIGHATQNKFANNGGIGPPDANAVQRLPADEGSAALAGGAGAKWTVDNGHGLPFAGVSEFTDAFLGLAATSQAWGKDSPAGFPESVAQRTKELARNHKTAPRLCSTETVGMGNWLLVSAAWVCIIAAIVHLALRRPGDDDE